jgi:SHS2 domain-containing protein
MPHDLYSPQPFEELEHTADAGVRVRGRDAEETLARLVLAFGALLTRGGPVRVERQIVVNTDPAERAFMAIDVLRELLFRFDRDGLVPASCSVERFDETEGTVVRVGVGLHDAEAHAEGMELKAVTLHQARFQAEAGAWVAEVVFDV